MTALVKARPLLIAPVLIAAATLLGVAPRAAAQPSQAAAPEAACHLAGVEAERAWNIPAGLLTAIGRTESGRANATSGQVTAWPWTINANGQGAWFNTQAEAAAVVRSLQMRGVRSIDVGCFQINMVFHPGAFDSLDQAFHPRFNANYAARFLSELHDRSGSWETAVAWYHSATPGIGEAYRNKVLADWSGGGMRVLPAPPPARGIGPGAPLIWNVLVQSMGIRVWTPGAAAATPIRRISAPPRPARSSFLPRVITPRG
jgi:hypothetical protein